MTNTLAVNDLDCNFIKETVVKIDKLQKEVVSDSIGRCISCETSLFTSANNTIPVAFTTSCSNPVLGRIGATETKTPFFRIESVRCGRFVTLRLLEGTEGSLTGTDYTIILDLDKVVTIQCFGPITVAVCGASEPE